MSPRRSAAARCRQRAAIAGLVVASLVALVLAAVVRADDVVVDTIAPLGLGPRRIGPGVAIEGDRILAAAGDPDAYVTMSAVVLERDDGAWTPVAWLRAPEALPYTDFGSQLALCGGVAVVGESSGFGQGQDRVGVYRRAPDGTWPMEAVLDAPGGSAIALHDDILVVGTRVFEHEDGQWPERRLDVPDGLTVLADAVDTWGGRIAALTSEAVVLLFERDGDAWTARDQITLPGPVDSRAEFRCLALDANTIAVGNARWITGAEFELGANPGAVTVIERDPSSGAWAVTAILVNPQPDFGGRREIWAPWSTEFGSSVDVFGDVLVVGAPSQVRALDGAGAPDDGAVYTFVREEWTDRGTWRSDWGFRLASLEPARVGRGRFGYKAATDGQVAAVASQARGTAEDSPGLGVLSDVRSSGWATGSLRVDLAIAQTEFERAPDPSYPSLKIAGVISLPTHAPKAGDAVTVTAGRYVDLTAEFVDAGDGTLVAQNADRSATLVLHPLRSGASFEFVSFNRPQDIAGVNSNDYYPPRSLDGSLFLRIDIGDEHVNGEFTMVNGLMDRNDGVGSQSRPGLALDRLRVRRHRPGRATSRDTAWFDAYLPNDDGEPEFAKPITVVVDDVAVNLAADRVRGVGTGRWRVRTPRGRPRAVVRIDCRTGHVIARLRRVSLPAAPDGELVQTDVTIDVGAQRHATRVTTRTRKRGRVTLF